MFLEISCLLGMKATKDRTNIVHRISAPFTVASKGERMQGPTPMLPKSPEALQRGRSRGLSSKAQDCAPATGRLDSWTLRKVLYFSPHWPGLNINWRMKSSLTGKYHVESLHSLEQILAQVKKLDVPISRWVKLHRLLLTLSVKCCQ